MSEDSRKEIQRKLVNAQADLDEKRGAALVQVEAIYVNRRAAFANMNEYARKHGDAALVKRLEESPSTFGTMKGHLGADKAFSLQGLRDKNVAKELAKTLPSLVQECLAADNKVLALEKAYKGLGSEGLGPSKGPGKGGPDFT